MESEETKTTPKAPRPSVADRKLAERQREIQLEKAERVATTATSMFDPVAYAQMKQLAADLIAGGAATKDADTPEKLLVKLQAGFELGMTPIEASNSLYIVGGRVTIWGAALIRQFRKQGWSLAYDESPDSCTVTVTRTNYGIREGVVGRYDEYVDTFLFQDAVDSGYVTDNYGKEKVGWRKGQNRKLKMRYGAAAQLAKTYLPEVLGSATGVAEIEQDAPVIEGEVVNSNEYVDKIRSAASREEIKEVIDSAPVELKRGLVAAAQERMKELEG